MKFGCSWRKISRKSECGKDSESTLQGSAALLQPVSDSRVVEAVGAVAKGFYFLLAAAGSAVVLFALSIAVVCASTNAAYFAG